MSERSKDEMIAGLSAFGIEVSNDMPLEDLQSLFNAIVEDGVEEAPNVPASTTSNLADHSGGELNNAVVGEDSTWEALNSTDDFGASWQSASSGEAALRDVLASQDSTSMLMSSSTQNSFTEADVSEFQAMTGGTADIAHRLLEMAAGDLNVAVTLFFDGVGGGDVTASLDTIAEMERNFRSTSASAVAEAAAAEAAVAEENARREEAAAQAARNAEAFRMTGYNGMGWSEDFAPRVDEFDEFGVRRPDPVRRGQLIAHSRAEEDDGLRRAEASDVSWMYPPATTISDPRSFSAMRADAVDQKRWILVNVQDHTIFACHQLNRHVWTDESLIELLRTSFIFWQRGVTSQDGQEYMERYRVDPTTLPHVAIIDPRTGAKMALFLNKMQNNLQEVSNPASLVTDLCEFLETHSFEQTHKFRRPSQTTTPNVSDAHTLPTPPPSSTDHLATLTPPPAAISISRYGESPVEASPGSDVATVALRLCSGRTLTCNLPLTEKVSSLFAYVAHHDEESGRREFTLRLRMPAKDLSTLLDQSLEEAELRRVAVIQSWV